MQPFALFCLLGFLWVLLHFWVHPLLETEWKARDLRRKIMRAGALTVVQKLRDLAAIGALTVLVVLAFVAVANLLGEAGIVWPKAAIEALASTYKFAKRLSDGYGAALGWIGLAGAAAVLWWAGVQARRRVHAVWMQTAQAQHSSNLADATRIEAARSDPDLLPIVNVIDEAIATIERARASESPDAEAIEQAQAMFGHALTLLAIKQASKKIDFFEAAGTPAPTESEQPTNRWQRLLRAMSSKRFIEDAGLIKKPVGWAATALLFVSLIGWTAQPMAASLQLAVNNLRVQLLEKEAQRDLQQALSVPVVMPEHEPVRQSDTPGAAQQVQAATRLLTNAIVRELTRSPVLDRTAGVRRPFESQAEFVRAALAQHEMSSASDDVVDKVRAEVAAKPAGESADGPQSTRRHVEAQVQPVVEELQKRHPNRVTELIARLEARYSQPMSPLDAQGRLTGRIVEEAFGALDAGPENELGRQAQRMGKDFGKEAVKTWANAQVKRFLADTLANVSRGDVLREFAFEASDRTREIVAAMQARENRGWTPPAAARKEGEMAAKVANAVAEQFARAQPRMVEADADALRERLGGYERLFPPEEGPSPLPEHGPASGGGDGGAGNTAGSNKASPPGSGSRHRASSFQVASRSFRVRGVLVGQSLDGTPLDITALRWRIAAPARPGGATRVAVEARLIESEGRSTWLSIGNYEAGVLNQALRYAADRRVVATTITAGDGRVTGRLTYLHPVLADTPLGCRIVEADRFIDTFTAGGQRTAPDPTSELASDRSEMYMWMRTAAVAERVGIIQQQGTGCEARALQEALAKSKMRPVRFSPGMRTALDTFLIAGGPEGVERHRLLKQAWNCAGKAPESLGQCLCDSVGTTGLPPYYWFPEDHTSQVREKNTRISSDLAWLRPSSDRLGHLDFWVHTTFSLRRSGTSDEGQTRALDFPSPQVAALRQQVGQQLPMYLQSQLRSPDYEAFMAPLEEFVLAQRWVRAALAGQLGRDFPMPQLLALEKETRPYVPRQVTIRWEEAGMSASLQASLGKADAAALDAYRGYLADSLMRRLGGRPVCDAASK